MANIIELKDIKKVYGTVVKTEVLHDVDLEIEESSFLSIVGQSGSGKSTLMNIMGTLDQPTSGEITISGKQTKALGMRLSALYSSFIICFPSSLLSKT